MDGLARYCCYTVLASLEKTSRWPEAFSRSFPVLETRGEGLVVGHGRIILPTQRAVLVH